MSRRYLADPWIQSLSAVFGLCLLLVLADVASLRSGRAAPAAPASAPTLTVTPPPPQQQTHLDPAVQAVVSNLVAQFGGAANQAASANAAPVITPMTGHDPTALVMGPAIQPLAPASLGQMLAHAASPIRGAAGSGFQPMSVPAYRASLPPSAEGGALKAKKRGRWVVSASQAPDVDSGDLRAVVASAASGDSIELRDGVYDGGFSIRGKSLSIRGPASGRKPIVSCHDGFPGLTVLEGTLALESVDVGCSDSSPSDAALSVRGAKVTLENVMLYGRASAQVALRALNSTVSMTGGSVAGIKTDAVLAEKSKAKFSYVTFIHEEAPLIAFKDATVELRQCTVALKPHGRYHAYFDATVSGADPAQLETRRSDAEKEKDRELLGALHAKPPAGQSAQGFRKDIFTPGRRHGDIP